MLNHRCMFDCLTHFEVASFLPHFYFLWPKKQLGRGLKRAAEALMCANGVQAGIDF